jgi:O-glycosyl hydrolase
MIAFAILLASAMASSQSTANISFGVAEAWMSAFNSATESALFSTSNNQLGLTILRVRIDPRSKSISTTGESNRATELANAQGA